MFNQVKLEFASHFTSMVVGRNVLHYVEIDREAAWAEYLNGFAPVDRQEHDCNTCKSFVRQYAGLVTITDDMVVKSIWGFNTSQTEYQGSLDALCRYVQSLPITDVFITKNSQLGTHKNYENIRDSDNKITGVVEWHHFALDVPARFLTRSAESCEALAAPYRDARNVLERGLREITTEATQTVLDLVAQNALYRGEQYKGICEVFLQLQTAYHTVEENKKSSFCWLQSGIVGQAVSKIRNTAIGTLLIDLSNPDIELDIALRKFERVVAPTNYQRPQNTVVSAKQIEAARQELEAIGYLPALERRFATADDFTVNNLLFVDRSTAKTLDIFDTLKSESGVIEPKNLLRVSELSLEDFIANVIPTAQKIEILVENSHLSNLCSLTAPVNPTAPSMFKWGAIAHAYRGGVADSLRADVAKAGGSVSGYMRFSIRWNEKDDNKRDFDAHCYEPRGGQIYYGERRSQATGGTLDVDIQHPSGLAVENITWEKPLRITEGEYRFAVHNFSGSTSNGGFTAEFEFNGETRLYKYDGNLGGKQYVDVLKIKRTSDGYTVMSELPSTQSQQTVWGVQTKQFHTVSHALYSPNYWDGHAVGNRHVFFALAGCINNEPTRGWFNEFLDESLRPHRKFFELLGSRLLVAPSTEQVSGLGFSTTSRADFVVRVTGSYSRLIRVKV